MPRYRVRVVVEKQSEGAEEYVEIDHTTYMSASSDWCEGIMKLYTALKSVAFYWNVVDQKGERQ